MIAHDIASTSENQTLLIRFSKNSPLIWECLGYTGRLVKFGRLIGVENKLFQVFRYVNPEKLVYPVKEKEDILTYSDDDCNAFVTRNILTQK